MLFHDLMADELERHGVDTVFGLIGDANLYVVDSFCRRRGGRFISVAHEAAAVLAANGYANVTQRVGVATVTHGPALTNVVTALVESVRDRSPVVLLAGDTAPGDLDNLQDIDQQAVIAPTGAGFEQVRSASSMTQDVARTFQRAVDERRPIVLDVPVDLQWQEAEPSRPREHPQAGRPPTPVDADQLDAALGVIAVARRPLVLAGRGAIGSGGREALVRLAAVIGAPVATTLRARDLFAGHPHDVGVFGNLSSPTGLDAIAAADCIIAFGAGLNKRTTANGALLAGRAVVQVDADPAQLARGLGTAAVLGDAVGVATAMAHQLAEAGLGGTGFASASLADQLREERGTLHADVSENGTVDIRTAMDIVDREVDADRIVVSDTGRFLIPFFSRVHARHPRDHVYTVNFGSIGLGMGTAVGAAAGSGRRTLLITGDGGFMLGGLAEFNTAVRHALDIVVVVMNDGAYGAEHVQFRAKDMDPSLSTFAWPDLAALARTLGGAGYTARHPDELTAVLGRLRGHSGPVLIDVRIDPDRVAR